MTDEELREQFEKTWRHIEGVSGEVADVKRHMDVVAEGLKKDIQLIGRRRQPRRALIGSSYGQLDRRVSALERRKR
jgi:hypothetical protein